MRMWHIEAFIRYSGGIAQILTLGDAQVVVDRLAGEWLEFAAPFGGGPQIAFGLPARYRAGDPLPNGVVAVG